MDALTRSPRTRDLLDKEAEDVRDRARRNARAITTSNLLDAIVAEPASLGASGYEAKVGYDKSHPGFVLWWHEVGTVNFPPRPHLRPAVRRGRPD